MKNVKTVTTNWKKGKFWEEESLEVSSGGDVMHMLKVYPEPGSEVIEGFGGAFTEASAVNFPAQR